MKKLLLILLCVPLIGLGQEINISTQTTNTKDTIRFLEKKILIDNVNTNREYYQAMLSLIDNEIKNAGGDTDTNPEIYDDSDNDPLKGIKYYYYSLLQGTEDFNIVGLSNSAEKIETKLQQYLINNPEKVQFHINKGKKYDTGANLEIYDKEYQEKGYFDYEDDEFDNLDE